MDVLLFAFALALGLLAAVPVGGCQIEMAKRAISGHLVAAEMVVLGSVTSDVVYGVVALYGIAPVLENPGVLAAFNAGGAVILWVLAILTWRSSRHPHEIGLEGDVLRRRRWSYLTGLFVGLSNPPMILSWLFGVALARRVGLSPPAGAAWKPWFIAGGALGLGGYLAALGVVTYRVRRFFSLEALARVSAWLAVVLLLLSVIFVHGVVAYFLRPS